MESYDLVLYNPANVHHAHATEIPKDSEKGTATLGPSPPRVQKVALFDEPKPSNTGVPRTSLYNRLVITQYTIFLKHAPQAIAHQLLALQPCTWMNLAAQAQAVVVGATTLIFPFAHLMEVFLVDRWYPEMGPHQKYVVDKARPPRRLLYA